MKFRIGMRKIKSVISLVVAFFIWQLIRFIMPGLEPHPIFAYIYSVMEIRATTDETKKFGKLRIKATFIGLITAIFFIAISALTIAKIEASMWRLLAEVLVILIATLISLIFAEKAKCESFCGVAAMITIMCLVSHGEEDIYLHAIMRVCQTLIGVFSALIVNILVKKEKDN